MLTCSITYWKAEDVYIVRVRDDEGHLIRSEQFDTEAAAERWASAVQRGEIILDW